ncbi:MAG: hypothetical protein QNJ53_17715 [Pleurocapsa sp. MO_192.B19]|nr:hypothetical protein [Pleurocapsa sp. MO_192.B19]
MNILKIKSDRIVIFFVLNLFKDNYKQLGLKTKVVNSELFVPISDHQSSQLVGGQFSIVLEEVGEIPELVTDPLALTLDTETTAIRIENATEFDLSYGFNYGKFEDVVLEARQTETHFGNTSLASAGWDKDLRQPHIQLDMALLKPGHLYKFKQM